MIWNKNKPPKENNPVQKVNKNILTITYLIAGVFFCLVLYIGYFLQVQSEDVINNSYNARLDSFAKRVVRGRILSNDGTVLAETLVGQDGEETRNYPYGPLFAHVVGYTAKGKTGLEALANFYLLTSHVNLIEQTVNELSGKKNLGDNVVTTLDLGLQQAASDALGGRKGAVVVMEPDTGKVLAMISRPEYNPNTLDADWDTLTAPGNPDAQLLNRATQGLYPPGSTFKIVTALEYIREHPDDYQNYEFDCNGRYDVDGYTIKCFRGEAHGHQDLKLAFANSCNGAFANLGMSLDLSRLKHTAEDLLFNKDLPLSIAYNKSSYVMEAGADPWDILQTSIGQGRTQITPMHNAMIAAAIANGGTLMKPYFLDHVENVGGETIKKFMPSAFGSPMTARESAILSDMMREVVTVGTGSALRTDAYTVAGKTGSAEFDSKKETHAWFIGFAPVENPKLAVSVLVEEGGTGGKTAAPIARKIFDTYFSR